MSVLTYVIALDDDADDAAGAKWQKNYWMRWMGNMVVQKLPP